MSSFPLRGYVFAFICSLGAGVSTVLGKVVLMKMEALPFVFYVALLSLAFNSIFLLLKRKEPLALSEKFPFHSMCLHIVFCYASIWALWTGVKQLNPAIASFLERSEVLFALFFSVLLLRERLSRWQSMGAVVAIAGIFMMKTGGVQLGEIYSPTMGEGYAFILFGAFFLAAAEVCAKQANKKIPPAVFAFFRSVGLVVAFGISMIPFWSELAIPDRTTFYAILGVAFFGPVAARICWMYALQDLPLSQAIIATQSQALITAALSYSFLGYAMNWAEWVGGIVIIAGCVITLKPNAVVARSEATK